jgi:hypothetical protein
MTANMLTEQNIVMESIDSNDTQLPIGFITTDDGHTLLAVAGKRIKVYIKHIKTFNILK